MIRLFDIILSFLGLLILFPIIFLIFIICLLENSSPIFIQTRIGFKKKLFTIFKFRTMKMNTKSIATHLVDESKITFFGNYIRRTKLDEAPQLINVLIGNMSIVGPRPCLPNQKKLIFERKKRRVFEVKPGITGLAQINGIDMKNPILLAKTDLKMIKKFGIKKYFYYIFKTLLLILN